MVKQKKFRIINFYIGPQGISYGLLLHEEEYGTGKEYVKRHILKVPFGVNKLLGKTFKIESVDEFQKLELPIVAGEYLVPFKANVYFHDYKNNRLHGVWPIHKETILETYRSEIKALQARIAQVLKNQISMSNENRAFKAELERLKQEKAKRDMQYTPRTEEQ